MKKISFTLCVTLLAISLLQGQESKEKEAQDAKPEKLHVALKEGANPDIYVDGKKFDFPMGLIDKDKIESINVLKGDKALQEYNAKNGVVLITTKKNLDGYKVKIKSKGNKEKAPLIIVNGEKSDRKALKKLAPDDIESIEVVKDEQAMKKYKAPNGVVIVKTKKGKKD
ncbi:MAG: hypothetical protein AAF554_12415 [Bacteroidota bacterium]